MSNNKMCDCNQGRLACTCMQKAVERLRNCLRTEVEAGDSWKKEAQDLREEVERLNADLESVKSARDAFAQNAIDLRAQRAEFEEWAKAQGLSVTRTPNPLCFANGSRRQAGDYIDLASLCSFAAWQARAALDRKPSALITQLQRDLTERDELVDQLRSGFVFETGPYEVELSDAQWSAALGVFENYNMGDDRHLVFLEEQGRGLISEILIEIGVARAHDVDEVAE